MKLDTARPFKQESTVQGEAIAMSVEADAMAHIMGILTNMYEDAEMASIREYAVNALDAHIEAGQSRPIEVTTPTALRPVLTIQDWGVGLSPADVRDIYSRYGASTKRDTDEQTGGLGIGCKAALAYCDQFTLRAVKDGEAIHVQIGRDAEGGGTMTVIDAGPTNDPNGVLVSIPAPRDNDLAAKAADLFRYWDEGTVLLNGKAPASVWAEGEDRYALTEDVTVIEDSEGSYGYGYRTAAPAVIVQGGVPYEAELEDAPRMSGVRIVARVPIGSVHFAPSREALMDTPATKATLASVTETVTRERLRAPQREVDAADSRGDALARFARVCGLLNHWPDNVTWNGETLPAEIQPTNPAARFWHVPAHNNRSWRGAKSEHSRPARLGLAQAGGSAWVLGFSNQTWSKTMREKLDSYVAANNGVTDPGRESYILTADRKVPSDWLVGLTTIKWEDVKNWRDPNAPKAQRKARGKFAGTYPAYAPDGTYHAEYPAADLDKAAHVFWTPSTYELNKRVHDRLRSAYKGCALVRVTGGRLDKFKRLFPNARAVQAGFREAADRWASGLTDSERRAITFLKSVDHATRTILADLDHAELRDPELSQLARDAKLDAPEDWQYWASCTEKAVTGEPITYKRVMARYPLLQAHRRMYGTSDAQTTLHLTLYANAVHAANERGSE